MVLMPVLIWWQRLNTLKAMQLISKNLTSNNPTNRLRIRWETNDVATMRCRWTLLFGLLRSNSHAQPAAHHHHFRNGNWKWWHVARIICVLNTDPRIFVIISFRILCINKQDTGKCAIKEYQRCHSVSSEFSTLTHTPTEFGFGFGLRAFCWLTFCWFEER